MEEVATPFSSSSFPRGSPVHATFPPVPASGAVAMLPISRSSGSEGVRRRGCGHGAGDPALAVHVDVRDATREPVAMEGEA